MSGAEYILLLVPLLLVGVVLFWFVNRNMDEERIKSHVRQKGGEVTKCLFVPTGHGWWADQQNRMYDVRYADVDGVEHQARARASLFKGVTWVEDRTIGVTGQAPTPTQLEAENRRLKEEVERLKAQQKKPGDKGYSINVDDVNP
jgi:hypothetical protein